MGKSVLALGAILLVLVVDRIQCQAPHHFTPNFLSPFDAWSKHFPPILPPSAFGAPSASSSSPLSSSFWNNFHNDDVPAFRDSDFGSFSIEERTERPIGAGNDNPLGIDVIDSAGNPQRPDETDPSVLFHHSIPFFENYPFFSTFGGFGFNRRKEPWWKGPNVCTERKEDIEDEKDTKIEGTDETTDTDGIQTPSPIFGGLLFSVNSCTEKPHKHVCKQMVSKNGAKKTLTVTHQCCHGYGRAPNADVTSPCEKIDLKSIIATAEEMGAKEFVKSAKNNELEEKLLSNITLFLPTDQAFTEFSEQMFENNLVVLPLKRARRAADTTGITTKELALNHMVDGWVDIQDVRNEEIFTTNFENATIRVNVFPKPPNAERFEYPFRYTANCAPIVKANRITTNGIIHAVDKVLQPVTMNVMDIIRSRSDMAVLRTILEKTNMHELLEGDKPVTIFAPTDKAFEKLDMHLRRTLKEGRGCAANILKNHILDLTFCSVAAVADAKTTAYNLLGQAMIFERAKVEEKQTEGEEVADLTGIQDIIINGEAKIIETDLMGTNGVLHVVDTIMPTDTALPITSLLERKNLTIFKRLIEASDLQDQYDDLNNVTFFAPSDKALSGSNWAKLLDENPDGLKNNDELKEFLGYHVVQPMIKTCDLNEKMMPTRSGAPLRVNLYSTHALFTNVMNRATVNCARLVHFDDESCGSVLHQVDKVLAPPKMTLLEMLEANPEYSMFYKLVQDANLTHLLQKEDDSFTLLVPKNDVFLEVEDYFNSLPENKAELETLVKTHIVNDVICCAGIIPTNWPFVRTVQTINDKKLRLSRDRRPKVENAGVTKCDIVGKNGIIHEINDVIVNPATRRPVNHNFHDIEDIFFKK